MDNFLHAKLKETELNCDMKVKPLQLGSDCLWLNYFESIVNYQETINYIWSSGITSADSFQDICIRLAGKELSSEDMNNLDQSLVVLIATDGERAFSFKGKLQTLTRAIDMPNSETLPYGPAVSFMESINTNIGLLRNAIKSPYLKTEGFTFTGALTKDTSLVYHSNCVDKELLNQLRTCLQKASASGKELQNGQDLIKVLGCNRFDILPPFCKTEIPAQALASILKGRVLLLVDGEPVAYVLPLIFSDYIALAWDKNHPFLVMMGLRLVRLLSIGISLLTPALYVAVVSVNPEALRNELALNIATSRTGIPIPTFLEILILMIVSEITFEATQRLPKVMASTVTLTSGIVLGTAIVDAKLVSSLVIIVISITATANFAFPNYLNSFTIRILRIGILVPAGMFGVFGVFGGFIAICFYVSGIERFGVPFMSFLSSRRLGKT
ncbi:spore germination protein [Paenibacillus sp. CF384]|uniref:spore germination protein n=1 Tax=Paenibacillus sp. CF384 TaxID=1884382 RepID=UPI00089C6BC9|nr:spore germination protein [Paenibacillus sp. CF384]SDX50386.1 GerA spore germination protein [Paenibacillus sp. CF384]